MSRSNVALLRNTDLNTLVALDVLLRRKSVTEAAKEMGVTQSAMSHTLRRLRERFDDALLVRGKGTMVLTTRAEALVVPLQSGLLALERTLQTPDPFEATRSTRRFRIVSPDLFDVLVLPTLLTHFAEVAPTVDIAVVPRSSRLVDALSTGEVDIAIQPMLIGGGSFGVDVSPNLRQKSLFRDSFRCFVREGHPQLSGRSRLTLKKYCALSHLLVSPGGGEGGPIDTFLQKQKLKRRVALQVPNFSSAISLVESTDLLLTAPYCVKRVIPNARVLPLPFDFPEHTIAMLWHERFSTDPSHLWFRHQLVALTSPE